MRWLTLIPDDAHSVARALASAATPDRNTVDSSSVPMGSRTEVDVMNSIAEPGPSSGRAWRANDTAEARTSR